MAPNPATPTTTTPAQPANRNPARGLTLPEAQDLARKGVVTKEHFLEAGFTEATWPADAPLRRPRKLAPPTPRTTEPETVEEEPEPEPTEEPSTPEEVGEDPDAAPEPPVPAVPRRKPGPAPGTPRKATGAAAKPPPANIPTVPKIRSDPKDDE